MKDISLVSFLASFSLLSDSGRKYADFDVIFEDRDRSELHDPAPPTPLGLRVRTSAARLVELWVQVPVAEVDPTR